MVDRKRTPPTAQKSSTFPIIGWREWIAFPEFGISAIKAKIDTGARTSSIHAQHIKTFERRGKEWVRFQVHPLQRTTEKTKDIEAELLEYRRVTSSTGHASMRPVVVTPARLFGIQWDIELTLTSRDEMGFRMLLGREAIRGRFLIDPSKSFLAGRRKTKKRRR